MIAAALIIIFVVVRYISSSGQQATQQGDIASLQSQAELGKSALQAKNWWDDTYKVKFEESDSSYYLNITTSADQQVTVIDITESAYKDDLNNLYDDNEVIDTNLGSLYTNCMQGNATACKVLAALGGT
ncbi:hypothetical protein [Thermococcus sp. MV5]|uniref:hypothetical protein n=1 Tax=Thermococcus sp. MV5 TaxID=1638272 RepID=UPI0037424651